MTKRESFLDIQGKKGKKCQMLFLYYFRKKREENEHTVDSNIRTVSEEKQIDNREKLKSGDRKGEPGKKKKGYRGIRKGKEKREKRK